MNIQCPKHGEVKFTGTGDFIGDETPVTMYCPACVEEETTNIPKDILSCRVCNRLMGHGQQKEVLICNPCREIGYYIDEDTGMISDKRVDNEIAELDKSSPLYADMEDILEREKTNQLRLHTYADVWLGAIKR